jgi:hypothetical protein
MKEAASKAKWGIEKGIIRQASDARPVSKEGFSGFEVQYENSDGSLAYTCGLESLTRQGEVIQFQLIAGANEEAPAKILDMLLDSVQMSGASPPSQSPSTRTTSPTGPSAPPRQTGPAKATLPQSPWAIASVGGALVLVLAYLRLFSFWSVGRNAEQRATLASVEGRGEGADGVDNAESLDQGMRRYAKGWAVRRMLILAGSAAVLALGLFGLFTGVPSGWEELSRTRVPLDTLLTFGGLLFILLASLAACLLALGFAIDSLVKLFIGPPAAGSTPESAISRFYRNALADDPDVNRNPAYERLTRNARKRFLGRQGFWDHWKSAAVAILEQSAAAKPKPQLRSLSVQRLEISAESQTVARFSVEIRFNIFGVKPSAKFFETKTFKSTLKSEGRLARYGPRWYIESCGWAGVKEGMAVENEGADKLAPASDALGIDLAGDPAPLS